MPCNSQALRPAERMSMRMIVPNWEMSIVSLVPSNRLIAFVI